MTRASIADFETDEVSSRTPGVKPARLDQTAGHPHSINAVPENGCQLPRDIAEGAVVAFRRQVREA